MPTQLFPVILAGGSGTRLWPLSRKNYPKQFLRLQGESSLLQQTLQRAMTLPYEHLLVVSNEAHYFLCQEQLQSSTTSLTYLLEPCIRNTAAAMASTAHYLANVRANRDAIMLILPSDHWIADESTWRNAMLCGAQYASSHPAIVTFGIKPDSPKTGYGYIERAEALSDDVFNVRSFHEKPTVDIAQYFLGNGHYFWNSGMLVCRVGTFLDELLQHAPDIYHATELAVSNAYYHHDYVRLESEAFAKCRNESIDYAIMEKTQQAVVIPVDMQWSDLGCWTEVAKANPMDANGNTLHGKVIAQDSHHCLISSTDTLVATLGIHNQIIVATRDAILVADKRYSQQVKDIVSALGAEHAQLANEHQRVTRPWGYYEVLVEGETFKVKRLMVKPGAALSLQMHQHRAEHWVVVGGQATVVNHEQVIHLTVNQSTYIPKKTRHRLSNLSHEPLYVIEVQSGHYLGEDDITRFDDIYERANYVN